MTSFTSVVASGEKFRSQNFFLSIYFIQYNKFKASTKLSHLVCLCNKSQINLTLYKQSSEMKLFFLFSYRKMQNAKKKSTDTQEVNLKVLIKYTEIETLVFKSLFRITVQVKSTCNLR